MAKLKGYLTAHHKTSLVLLEAFFILLSLFIVIPLMQTRAITFSVDDIFHWQRVNEFARDISHFQFPMFNHYVSFFGGVTPTMYPWLTMFPAIILRIIGFSPITCLIVLILAILFSGFNIAYFSCQSVAKRRIISVIFATFYALSTILACYVDQEADYGYCLAIIFMPLVFFGWMHWRKNGHWKMMTAGLILIAFSHVLSAIIAMTFVIVITLLNAKGLKHHQVITWFKGFIILICTTAICWLPTFVLLLTNHISTPSNEYPIGHYAQLIPTSARGAETAFKMEYSLTDLFAVLILFACWHYGKLTKFHKQLFVIALVLLAFNFDWLPWSLIDKTPLAALQFPGRVCFISHIILTYLLAVTYIKVVSKYLDNVEEPAWLGFMLCLMIVGIFMLTNGGVQLAHRISVPQPRTLVTGKFKQAKKVLDSDALLLNSHYLSSPYILEMPAHFDYSPAHFVNRFKDINKKYQYIKYPIHNGALVLYNKKNRTNAEIPMCSYATQPYRIKLDGHTVKGHNHNGVMVLNHVPKGIDKITYRTPSPWYRWLATIMTVVGLIAFFTEKQLTKFLDSNHSGDKND